MKVKSVSVLSNGSNRSRRTAAVANSLLKQRSIGFTFPGMKISRRPYQRKTAAPKVLFQTYVSVAFWRTNETSERSRFTGAMDKLVQEERELLTSVLAHLREIERRRLFCDLGFSSLFSYAVEKLGYLTTRRFEESARCGY